MITNLVNSIGGYDSWLFAAISLGCFIIGGVITAYWRWAFPIPSFGALLMFHYLTFTISQIEIKQPAARAFASVIPIIWVLMSGLTIFYFFSHKKQNKSHKED